MAKINVPGTEEENCEYGDKSEGPGNGDREEKFVGGERELCPVLRKPQHPFKSDENLPLF